MSGIHLKDLSKVYREQIAEKKDDSYLETDMKKRQKNNEKARKDMEKMGTSMKNPHFEEVEVEEGYDEPKMHSAVKRVMTTQPAAKGRAASRLHSKYSMRSKGNVAGETDGPGPNAPKRSGRKGRGSETDRGSGNAAKRRMSTEGLDPVGREDGDVNNDGKKDGTDKYLMNRRKAIGKAIKKKMSEGVRDIDPEKGTAERKARLEKKRGMKLDDHPQFKKEEFIPEVMSDDMDEKPIKEKKVKNVVKINPKLGESVEEIGGELIEAVEIFDILEEITDQELRFVSDRMIDEIVEEFFLEAAEQDEDLEVLQQNLCESIDLSISLLLEQDAGAEARKRLGSGPSRASVMDRVKSAVKKHGPTVKAGLKKAGKAAARGAGYAAGAAVRGAKAAGREFSKGYERGRQGSSGSSDSSSSSSDSGSSSAPKKKGPGLLSRIGAKLKRGIGKAARAVSRGARNVARKMDEEIINERGDFWHPDPDEDRKLGGPGANQRAREDRGSSKPAAKKDYSKSLKPGESYMQFAKRKKAEKMRSEGYGAPGHNPGSGEKSVARAKALMDKQGRKGAPGLNAMMAAKKEHEARRGVKKEELENVEELYKGKHGQSDKEYMDSRSDAGKQISGDSKMSGAAYSHRSFKGQGKPAKPGERQKAQGRMTQADRDELAIRKAALKKEDADLDKMQKDADANRARAAKLKDKNVTRGSAALAARAVERDVKKAAKTGPQQYPNPGKGVKKIEKPKPTHTKTGAMRVEETEDSLRDKRMERGGVDGNVRYDKAPKFTSGPKKKYDGMSALDYVKADIRKKHGKGAIIDTKKK